jgi:hypothetical protein
MNPPIPSRRDFLRAGAAAGPAALLGSRLRADEATKLKPTADAVILLWMAGGQASTEVWDMKKYTPFEKGMEAKAVYSTFKSIPTSVEGVIAPLQAFTQLSQAFWVPKRVKYPHRGGGWPSDKLAWLAAKRHGARARAGPQSPARPRSSTPFPIASDAG